MHLELAKTLRNYDRKNLSKDILTGLIIMAVSIPISMGYAQIAGLPAVYGLYGSVFPIILFGLFSTSPQFIFGVDAAPAALVGAALVEMGIQSGSKQAMAVVLQLCFSCLHLCRRIFSGFHSHGAFFADQYRSASQFRQNFRLFKGAGKHVT